MKVRWDDEWENVRAIFLDSNSKIYWPIFAIATMITIIAVIVKIA